MSDDLARCHEELERARRTIHKRDEALWAIVSTVVIGSLLAMCTGCTSPYPMSWSRPGAGDDALRTEAAQCRVQAMTGSAPHRDAFVGLAAAEGIYRDCMIGKGWIFTAR